MLFHNSRGITHTHHHLPLTLLQKAEYHFTNHKTKSGHPKIVIFYGIMKNISLSFSLSLIWCHSLLCRHIFALSPLGCAKMQSYKGENAKLQLQRISILVSLLWLCIFAYRRRIFALSLLRHRN